MLEAMFGWQLGRWIYGLQGVLVAQVFAFTPIAFLVLIGVGRRRLASMEEAAQTLRATAGVCSRHFAAADAPGLAKAFLISFIESIADFGNPILLGGNFGVLSTEIFFSVVGAQLDQGRAATLGELLLVSALARSWLQRAMSDARCTRRSAARATAGCRRYSPTESAALLRRCGSVGAADRRHLCDGAGRRLRRDVGPRLHADAAALHEGVRRRVVRPRASCGPAPRGTRSGRRSSSPPSPRRRPAALGILTAYLLTRHRFAGRQAFEFGTMLSFAIPGTVIGVAYILAFNVPPIEITGTAMILIVCNVFRNMPVGVRAGIAAMSQIDKSLDEASTCCARGLHAAPHDSAAAPEAAIVAALVYSFVRAVTTLSAVIFLVSAEYEWATTYIINRVVNGDYGVAIAYSSVLIVLMLAVIFAIQWAVGERRLGRRAAGVVPSLGQLGAGAAQA
jgi:iron(III) transport system permease protein